VNEGNGAKVPRDSAPRTVLVVEDDEAARESYVALIEQVLGYPVVTAEDGQAALDLLRQGLQPSVIVLDLLMPQMDGVTFREQQLADPTLPCCPVIVCSAVLDSARQLEPLKASAYLQKPVEPQVLLRLVRAFGEP
jgi:CheY-like chemotaxis protein